MTEGAARAQLARRVENGSLEAARRRNRCTKKGWGGGGGVLQRAEKEGEAPCVHLVVGKTREKKFFERRCRFRCCASQPTNQPATFYQQFLLPASPAFSILLCPAALIEAWKEGENRRAFSSVPMELNLTCIRTSGRNLRELQQVTTRRFFFLLFFLGENFSLWAIRAFANRISKFFSFNSKHSLSLSPPVLEFSAFEFHSAYS